MMTIDENLMCSFQVLKPDENKGQNNNANANAGGGSRPGTPNKKVNRLKGDFKGFPSL